jgi:RNA polymerase sigma-70 factor (ECF subfamily)
LKNRHEILLELLEKSGAGFFTLLTRLTLREDVAEELMQELFIRLSNSGELDEIANLGAYARRAAINLAFDWRRSQKRNALDLARLNEQASNEYTPLSKMVRNEQLQQVLETIGRLNKTSREVLVMRYIEEQSNDDIAEQLHKTPHQVRALCSRALSQLRDRLGSNHSGLSGKETYNVED